MKKLALLILGLSLFYYPASAQNNSPCAGLNRNVQTNANLVKQSRPTKQLADDDNDAQDENEELQEYRSDLDESEDSGDTDEYGYDGSDGSSKSD